MAGLLILLVIPWAANSVPLLTYKNQVQTDVTDSTVLGPIFISGNMMASVAGKDVYMWSTSDSSLKGQFTPSDTVTGYSDISSWASSTKQEMVLLPTTSTSLQYCILNNDLSNLGCQEIPDTAVISAVGLINDSIVFTNADQ